jgi:hypothetical protein
MALEHTTDEEQTEKKLTEPAGEAPAPGDEDDAETQEDESSSGPFASARNLPRSPTNLPSPPSGKVSELTVTLLSDMELAASLDEIEKANSLEGGPRTPMMSVVHAVIASAGGTISIRDLAEEVRRYWNRPFPTSSYTPEEFIYLTARNSYDLRVNE